MDRSDFRRTNDAAGQAARLALTENSQKQGGFTDIYGLFRALTENRQLGDACCAGRQRKPVRHGGAGGKPCRKTGHATGRAF